MVIKEGLESFGMTGTIADLYVPGFPNSVFVNFETWNGENREKTIYIKRENLRKESVGDQMEKLIGYKKVAVIEQENNKNCYIAIFDDGTEYQIDDKILSSGSNQVQTIKEIISLEDAAQRYKGNIMSEVICKLDMSAYNKRTTKRKDAEELKRSMDKVIREMQEVDKYEMYANQNPVLKDMLEKYKSLVE